MNKEVSEGKQIKKFYSVWVGGSEVNDYEIETREEAEELARFWRYIQDYSDVAIEEREVLQ